MHHAAASSQCHCGERNPSPRPSRNKPSQSATGQCNVGFPSPTFGPLNHSTLLPLAALPTPATSTDVRFSFHNTENKLQALKCSSLHNVNLTLQVRLIHTPYDSPVIWNALPLNMVPRNPTIARCCFSSALNWIIPNLCGNR